MIFKTKILATVTIIGAVLLLGTLAATITTTNFKTSHQVFAQQQNNNTGAQGEECILNLA
jgi:hypothetical protein